MPAPLSVDVLAALRRCAHLHLAAIDFYRQGSVAHARLGYKKLGDRWAADREEEEGHMRLVLDRLAFFWEGIDEGDDQPPVAVYAPQEPASDAPATLGVDTAADASQPAAAPLAVPRDSVPEFLAAALDLERSAAEAERAGILTARAAGDEGSAVILVQLLAGSEASILELEGDLALLGDDQVGPDNWLANQV